MRIIFLLLFLLQSSICFGQLPVNIVGGQGGANSTETQAHVHPFDTSNGQHVGVVTLTHPFLKFQPEFHPFLNESFGTAMNQDVSFGGVAEIIHNGGSSTEWTATAIVGAWNFADAGKITLTSGNNNDQAEFAEENSLTIDMNGFTALTGKVDLDTYNPINNNFTLAFDLAGVLVGNTVNLNDAINTGDFTEQSFVITKAGFGLTTQEIDGFTMTLVRSGGAKPTVKFDDLQLEAVSGSTSDPIVFKATTPVGTRFHITELRIRIEDAFDSTLANATVPNIPIDSFLGVSGLTNGIIFSSFKDGVSVFSVTLKSIGDFLATGSDMINVSGNGTNTGLTLVINFPEPIILQGGSENNFLSFTINDNLSGLTRFTAAARGALEIR